MPSMPTAGEGETVLGLPLGLGVPVGLCVGLSVGLGVGLSVGPSVGLSVGDAVGLVVGLVPPPEEQAVSSSGRARRAAARARREVTWGSGSSDGADRQSAPPTSDLAHDRLTRDRPLSPATAATGDPSPGTQARDVAPARLASGA